jgi:protein SCO1
MGSEANQSRTRRARPWLVGVVALVLVIAGTAGGFFAGRLAGAARTARTGTAAPPDLGPAPSYVLTNQLGQTVSSRQLSGKVQVVTFLFPYCTTYCPLITAHLIGLEQLLAGSGAAGRVEIVAFNVAPGATGPAQMREFLRQYGWNPRDPHWQFLTGTPTEIRRVVTGGFHIAYERVADGDDDAAVQIIPGQTPQLRVANPLAEQAKPDFDVAHNDAIEIVDTHGRIRHIYQDADVVSNQQIWRVLQPLLGSSPPPAG